MQMPDFGDRFWVYALHDVGTDQFAELGKPYKTKSGFFCLLVPLKGAKPAGIEAVVHGAGQRYSPRLHGRHSRGPQGHPIGDQPNRVLSAQGLRREDEDEGRAQAPAISGPKSDGAGETKWVVADGDSEGVPLDGRVMR